MANGREPQMLYKLTYLVFPDHCLPNKTNHQLVSECLPGLGLD